MLRLARAATCECGPKRNRSGLLAIPNRYGIEEGHRSCRTVEEVYLHRKKLEKELADINKEARKLKTRLTALDR